MTRRRPLTSDDVIRVLLAAQFGIDRVGHRRRQTIRAYLKLQDYCRQLRRQEIFRSGARCRKIAEPITFKGRSLGSMERRTFYDGYASTHPGFRSPYHAAQQL